VHDIIGRSWVSETSLNDIGYRGYDFDHYNNAYWLMFGTLNPSTLYRTRLKWPFKNCWIIVNRAPLMWAVKE